MVIPDQHDSSVHCKSII